MDKWQNVLELLVAAKRGPYERGSEAFVYPLPEPFDDVVLRVPLLKRLDIHNSSLQTSCLTPINYGFEGRPLAPPIMEIDGITIHPKQHGEALKSMPPEAAREILTQMPYKEFLGLCDNIRFLNTIGYCVDPDPSNLLVTPDSLRWVDCTGQNTQLNNAKALNIAFRGFLDDSTISENIARAVDEVSLPLTNIEAIIESERHPFRAPIKIETIAKIPLSATPAQFREALTETKEYL